MVVTQFRNIKARRSCTTKLRTKCETLVRRYSVWCEHASPRPCQHEGHVVGLFLAANPIHNRREHSFANARQGLVAIVADQLDEPFLPELAKVVFWLGHAIAEGQKNVTRSQVNRTLFVIQGVKESHDGAAAIQATHVAVPTDDKRR